MCVLIVKPKNTPMPDIVTLSLCRRANPDGFGFVSETQYYRSTNFATFMRKLREVDDKESCIIHFRWATHGSVKTSNCHPFKDSATSVFFAHNGVLPIASKNDKTDSEICFREQLMPVINKYGYDSQELNNAVYNVIGSSKFAFMHNKKIKMFGRFEKVNGVYYSNLRWMRNMCL